jgi:hypothetical protein
MCCNVGRFVDNAVWKPRGERVRVVRGFGRGVFVALGFSGFNVCWRVVT